MTESIGNYLRRERELRKISLSEVAEQTRVRLDYLEAIESEHFEKIPGITFARGYLKSYAAAVGLMPEDVLLRFEDFLAQLSGGEALPPPRAKFHLAWLLLLPLLFAVVTILVLWLKK
ncbi:MAG TPA: hypothetical protein DF383_12110 [Deltaproteobacteria bacterium]|nr:hypothetical protein [Deltaproteobacteria bacterium]